MPYRIVQQATKNSTFDARRWDLGGHLIEREKKIVDKGEMTERNYNVGGSRRKTKDNRET